MRGLSAAQAVLDARLRRFAPTPLAVAYSGGGDSLALLLITRIWAQANGRRLLVLTLDHGLQALGADWVRTCAATAERLELEFQALRWDGEKPAQGLPAAARAARHRLLAEAARASGARVILLGHTADDRIEAQQMREGGGTTPDPRIWSPSPIWPQGRGLFLLRPLLPVRRADIRVWLQKRGETWIEDPANVDPRYARARARAALAGGGEIGAEPVEPGAGVRKLALSSVASAWGGLATPRALVRDAHLADAARFVASACLCAAGTARPPRGQRLMRLVAAVRGVEPVKATLAGARIEADTETLRFWREPGEAARGGLAPLDLIQRQAVVWDGRFEIESSLPGVTARRLAGGAARLAAAERRALTAVPAPARGALPVLVDPTGALRCPVITPMPGVRLVALAKDRLLAACGAIEREPG